MEQEKRAIAEVAATISQLLVVLLLQPIHPGFIDHHHSHRIKLAILFQAAFYCLAFILRHLLKLKPRKGTHGCPAMLDDVIIITTE